MNDFMQPGFNNEIIFTNAFNADFVKDRSNSLGVIQISIVSSSGFVVAQSNLDESALPQLTRSKIMTAEMNRDTTRPGANDVEYELTFEA